MNHISSLNEFSSNFKKTTQSYRDSLSERSEKLLEPDNTEIPTEFPVKNHIDESLRDNFNQSSLESLTETKDNSDELLKEEFNSPQPVSIKPSEPIGYKIFRDKVETFQCKVYVEGSTLANTKVRLFLDSKEWNLVFYGSIDSDGLCKIPLKKMTILSEYCVGEIRLEVISDDTVFTPWKERFTVIQSKKVSVEIISNSETNRGRPDIKISDIR